MEFLTEYGMFLAKTVTFVAAIGILIGLSFAVSSGRSRRSDKGHIEVTPLNEKYQEIRETLRDAMLDPEAFKEQQRAEKKRLKAERAEKKRTLKAKARVPKAVADATSDGTAEAPENTEKKRVFVIDFHGDVKASEGESLREVVSAVLSSARTNDEVVVKVESGGGMVHQYGLAASQLARITQKNIPLTVCVDRVAASGGYLMACVANKIIAAPFALLGSIGVVAQLPNFHKLLKKHDIDYELYTAGKFKRTVTMFGENTPKGREKFLEDLEDVHVLFKEFVTEHRPQVDIEQVATGEAWFGRRALEVNLVDELKTSDEYLQELAETADIFQVDYTQKKSLPERLGFAAQQSVDRLLLTWWERLHHNRWF